MGIDQRKNRAFAAVLNHESNVVLRFKLFLEIIGHAARHDDHGIVICACCLTNGCPRFLVALVGHRAGIHHHHIGRLVELYQLVTCRTKIGHQRIGFVLIQPTTEGFKCDFFGMILIHCSIFRIYIAAHIFLAFHVRHINVTAKETFATNLLITDY